MTEDANHGVGRPPKFKTPKEMDKAVDDYFNGGCRKVNGQPCPTVTDLVLYLGFCDRSAFYAYEKKKEFKHTIKRARALISREYEQMLHKQTCTGAIFALKNLGWSDKREIEHIGQEAKIVIVYPSNYKKVIKETEKAKSANRIETIPGGVSRD